MQHEITSAGPLLDEHGNLREPGYSKRMLLCYERAAIKVHSLRIKEWDYYIIMNDSFGVALTVADNSYMSLVSASFLDFANGTEVTKSPMGLLPRGKLLMPPTTDDGDVNYKDKTCRFSFKKRHGRRVLSCWMKDFGGEPDFEAEFTLTDEPEESIVIATPFDKRGHFYYNQKINCMRAEGRVKFRGDVYTFSPDDATATLDWGRGVWTYDNTWYWGSASGYIGGVQFGFNIGYGFGNTGAASENMLFYGGKSHKLSQVAFNIPQKNGRDDYMSPWTFSSDDGRFEMDFAPVLDRKSKTSALVILSDQHQVFGRYSGTATLDDGTQINIKDFIGFAEKVRNKW